MEQAVCKQAEVRKEQQPAQTGEAKLKKNKLDRRTLVRTVLMVIPMALVLCATSQFVRYGSIQPNLLAKSLPVGFLCAFFCNLCLPLGENALWLTKRLPLSPANKAFGYVVSFFFSMQFAAIMTCVMCFYNVVLLNHQALVIFFRSWGKVYVPCLAVAYLTSSLWKPRAEQLSRRLVPLREGAEPDQRVKKQAK